MTKKFRLMLKVFTICTAGILLAASCAAPTEAPVPTSTRAPLSVEQQNLSDEIDELFINLNENGEFSGVVLVEYKNDILLEKGYGYADRSEETSNTPQTRFRLYATSKPYTALGILALQEAGKLFTTDPACKYIASCPAGWEEITIKNLLNGDSRLQDYLYEYRFYKTTDQPIDKKELLAYIKNFKRNPYGSDSDGNTDYTLLAEIIERVSGKGYEDYLTEAVFEPLGLENTGIVHGIGETDGLAEFYLGVDSLKEDRTVDMSNYFGNGDIYSSVEDTYLMLKALRSGNFLSAETIGEMFTADSYGHGYGWTMFEFELQWIAASLMSSQRYHQYSSYQMSEDGNLIIIIFVNQDRNAFLLQVGIIEAILGE